jgi:hypothetical protein
MIDVDFNVINQLLIRYSTFVRYWEKMVVQWYSTKLFIEFKKAFVSVRKEVLYNILIELSIPVKLAWVIKSV